MDYTVRLMHVCDIPQVKEIDREAFPTQWPPTNFSKDLNNGVIRYLVAYEGNGDTCLQAGTEVLEAEVNSSGLLSRIRSIFDKESSSDQRGEIRNGHNILGYAAMWLMVDEAHITSIAVRETHRRRGIGELLLTSIIDLATELEAQIVTLEVRTSNLSAQALYEKYGFSRVGLRRGYYSDDGEDALIMTAEDITSASYQARLKELRQNHRQKGESEM